MLLLVLVALAVPAVSFAGGSAGDQQYTDPFGATSGSGSHSASTSTSSPATTTSSPAQTTPPSTTPAAPTPSADPTTAAVAPTTAGDPTATMAGGSSTTLPYTGYDAWTAVGFGLTLLAGGAALRWHLRARRA
jgi:cytoskeletal protein RodZ